MVKSVPVVEVANVTAPLEVVAKPVPIAVIVPAFCEIHVPLYWRQPWRRLIPFPAEVVAVPRVRAPTMVVEAFSVVDAVVTKPPENVIVVEVAFPTNGYAIVLVTVTAPVAPESAMPEPAVSDVTKLVDVAI